MPRKATTLTDSAIRAAQPREEPYKLADGQGLYLEVMPNGSKLWRFEYLFAGKENRITLGAYSQLTRAQALAGRDEAYQLLTEGKSPKAQRIKEALQAATPRSRVKAHAAWVEKNAHQMTELGFEAYVRNMREDVASVADSLESDGFTVSDKTMLRLKQLETDRLYLINAMGIAKRRKTIAKNRAKTPSPDWHEKALQLFSEGLQTETIKNRLGKSASQVRRVIARQKKHASTK